MAKNKKNKQGNQFFLLVILPLLAIFVSSLAIYKGLENYITSSHYFKIRDVVIDGITDARYVECMREEISGSNIFELDAQKLAERIKKRFPTFYNIRVTRVLPCKLDILARERIPVAIVRKEVYYLFDAQGVAIASFPLNAVLNYPLIVGLDNKLPKIQVGVSYETKALKIPLRLALLLRVRIPALRIVKIDAADLDNLVFYLNNDIQVKMGNRDFEERLNLLSVILKSLGTEITNVLYIDLRLKEPVISLRKK